MITKKEEKRIWKKIERVEDKIEDLRLSDKKRNAKIIKRNKKVRWPEKIDILGNSFEIILSENLTDSNGEKKNGLCYQRGKIEICLQNEDIVKTLLHELQHAVDFEYGNVLDELWKLRKNKYFNEFRVDTLAKIWLGIFKQLRGEE